MILTSRRVITRNRFIRSVQSTFIHSHAREPGCPRSLKCFAGSAQFSFLRNHECTVSLIFVALGWAWSNLLHVRLYLTAFFFFNLETLVFIWFCMYNAVAIFLSFPRTGFLSVSSYKQQCSFICSSLRSITQLSLLHLLLALSCYSSLCELFESKRNKWVKYAYYQCCWSIHSIFIFTFSSNPSELH